jgi:hypothetical protein
MLELPLDGHNLINGNYLFFNSAQQEKSEVRVRCEIHAAEALVKASAKA